MNIRTVNKATSDATRNHILMQREKNIESEKRKLKFELNKLNLFSNSLLQNLSPLPTLPTNNVSHSKVVINPLSNKNVGNVPTNMFNNFPLNSLNVQQN